MFLGRQRADAVGKVLVQFSAANHRTASHIRHFTRRFCASRRLACCWSSWPVARPCLSHIVLPQNSALRSSSETSSARSQTYLCRFMSTDETNQREVALADNTRVTCNGTDISADAKTIPIIRPNPIFVLGFCPRQPPGGSYKIAYTDEQGASTTATVPVPSGAFSILSPPPGSTVPIPIDDAFTLRLSLPTPPPGGSASVDDIMLTCGANENTCEELFWTDLQKEATPPVSATPTPQVTLTPFLKRTPSPAPAPTATLSQDGAIATITLRADYSQVAPNAARIVVFAHVQAPPDPGGFAAATAVYGEQLSSDITWTRSP